MKTEIKVLFSDLLYIKHNYGAQGLSFPLMEKLGNRFNAKYTFVIPQGYPEEQYSFSEKHDFNVVIAPRLFTILGKLYFPIYILYILIKGKPFPNNEKRRYSFLINTLRESDVVIDLSGIEFIGNVPLRKRYSDYLCTLSMQWLAEKYNKLYLKYTKSYGPFPTKDKIYRFLVRRSLNRLPFLFVRGKGNLDEVKKLKVKTTLYSFPDISLSLKAESRNWALNYVEKLGVDTTKKIVGLSPSAVIARMKLKNNKSSCGDNHIKLFKELIEFYRIHNQQVLIIPHSIVDGKDLVYCDLALARKIYKETKDKTGIYLVDDMDLAYDQMRAIIGLLDFYVTGRYHSISSALFMIVPTVALSWHMKYKDMISLFFKDFRVIECKSHNVDKSLALIKEAYFDRRWFDRERASKKKIEICRLIDQSVNILANEIAMNLGEKKGSNHGFE